jgi:hypothetical protein
MPKKSKAQKSKPIDVKEYNLEPKKDPLPRGEIVSRMMDHYAFINIQRDDPPRDEKVTHLARNFGVPEEAVAGALAPRFAVLVVEQKPTSTAPDHSTAELLLGPEHSITARCGPLGLPGVRRLAEELGYSIEEAVD